MAIRFQHNEPTRIIFSELPLHTLFVLCDSPTILHRKRDGDTAYCVNNSATPGICTLSAETTVIAVDVVKCDIIVRPL